MSEWKKWEDEKPEPGMKVIIICSDHCSSAPALIDNDGMPLHAEDGYDLGRNFVAGSYWSELPTDYHLAFMEITASDWY